MIRHSAAGLSTRSIANISADLKAKRGMSSADRPCRHRHTSRTHAPTNDHISAIRPSPGICRQRPAVALPAITPRLPAELCIRHLHSGELSKKQMYSPRHDHLHRVSKNVPPLACYNSDTCERILIFFWQKCYRSSKQSKDTLLCHIN